MSQVSPRGAVDLVWARGAGLELGETAGGGVATWALRSGGQTLAATDEAMTLAVAIEWALRLVGPGAQFGGVGPGRWRVGPAAGAGGGRGEC